MLAALDLAKRWMGTDIARGMILGRSNHFWLAPLEPLDVHPDDPLALERWIRAACVRDPRPYPRFLPVRWKDHYTALIVFANDTATIFDPHDDENRVHAPPPMNVIYCVLPNTTLLGDGSQRDPIDTFCVGWMTMFFDRKCKPGQGLPDVLKFIADCVCVDTERTFSGFASRTGSSPDSRRAPCTRWWWA